MASQMMASPQRESLEAVAQAHPHCRQLRAAVAEPFLQSALKKRLLKDSQRYLSPMCPRMKYQARPDNERSTCHWGQLKLYEHELRCLTDFLAGRTDKDEDVVVLYAGAAPGRHIPYLVKRFPNCQFVLYDPANFDSVLVELSESEEGSSRVELHQQFFDQASCSRFASRLHRSESSEKQQERGQALVFFSDIRTADEQVMNSKDFNASIGEDMERQRKWVEELRPDLSVLKFRLTWGPGTTEYLKGRVMIQAFPPCTSTETRLLVTSDDLAQEPNHIPYDHEEYEEKLMYHNTISRSSFHDLGLELERDLPPGLDGCYDCAALVSTARRYLAWKTGQAALAVSSEDVCREVECLLKEVGEYGGRTLDMEYHVSSQRHQGRRFPNRQYRDASGKDNFRVVFEQQRNKKRKRPNRNAAPAAGVEEA